MVYMLISCAVLLLVLQTLALKLQKAEEQAQKYFVSFAFTSLAACALAIFEIFNHARLEISLSTLLYGVAFGIMFALTIAFYNIALSCGPLSYTSFYFSASMIIPAVTGMLFFSEIISVPKIAALTLFLIAFFLINKTDKNNHKPSKRWMFYCFLTFIANGSLAIITPLQQKAANGKEAYSFMLISFAVAAISYFVLFLYTKNTLTPSCKRGISLIKQNAIAIILLAAGSAGGNLLLTHLAGLVPASYLFPVVQGSIIVCISLCGILIFKDNISRLGKLGLCLGVAAIVLMNL